MAGSGSKLSQLFMLLLCTPVNIRCFFVATILEGWRRVDRVTLFVAILGEFLLGISALREVDFAQSP